MAIKAGAGSPWLKVYGSGSPSQTYATVQAGDGLAVCATAPGTNLGSLQVPVTVGGRSVDGSDRLLIHPSYSPRPG